MQSQYQTSLSNQQYSLLVSFAFECQSFRNEIEIDGLFIRNNQKKKKEKRGKEGMRGTLALFTEQK